MTDLEIDPAALQAVRDKTVAIESLADRSVRQLGRLSGDGLGPASLEARAGSFGDTWSRGLEQLGVFAASVTRSLTVVEETFDIVDEGLSGSTPRGD